MSCTLCILAAGLGSRFKGGIKQLEPFGPNGEIIMDYSIYDAVEAGFDKVVFIIRKDIRDAFDKMIGDRISKADGRKISDYDDLSAALKSHSPGDTISVVVERNNEKVTLKTTLTASSETAN